jgi:precorrin-6Y C5,15-methyltransferase (decarboxylating)
MTAWVQVVGIGEDGLPGLGQRARTLVEEAEVFVGGRRHLAMVDAGGRPTLVWGSPIARTLDLMAEWQGRRCVVLASGDPMWFGVGKLVLSRFGREAVAVHPTVSAFALAASRLGWPAEDCTCISVHGRPLALLHRHLQPGARLLLLTDDGAAPAAIAATLTARGLAQAKLIVLERLGGDCERIVALSPAEVGTLRFADLNVVAIDLDDCSGTALSVTPGLHDVAYLHDGQLTKAESRAVALSKLAPSPGALLWDVGAGSGSVAIEWMRAAPRTRALAIERDPARVKRILANAINLGVPELEVLTGEAPACLSQLDPPDAVFVGGGVRAPGLLDCLWAMLKVGGRLVAHAVTLAGERALLEFHEHHGGELVRLAVSRAEAIGSVVGWRPLAPVTQLAASKSCARAA